MCLYTVCLCLYISFSFYRSSSSIAHCERIESFAFIWHFTLKPAEKRSHRQWLCTIFFYSVLFCSVRLRVELFAYKYIWFASQANTFKWEKKQQASKRLQQSNPINIIVSRIVSMIINFPIVFPHKSPLGVPGVWVCIFICTTIQILIHSVKWMCDPATCGLCVCRRYKQLHIIIIVEARSYKYSNLTMCLCLYFFLPSNDAIVDVKRQKNGFQEKLSLVPVLRKIFIMSIPLDARMFQSRNCAKFIYHFIQISDLFRLILLSIIYACVCVHCRRFFFVARTSCYSRLLYFFRD